MAYKYDPYEYKLNNWLDNISEEAKKQALRFLLGIKDPKVIADNAGFIFLQIEEFSRMYPIFEESKINGSTN